MSRRSKASGELGLPSLRQYWQEINRQERQAQVELRAKRKATDKKRAKCRCDAYKFPHRPGGGLCRYPDPPAVRWQDAHAAEISQRVSKFRAKYGEPDADQMADLIALTTKHIALIVIVMLASGGNSAEITDCTPSGTGS